MTTGKNRPYTPAKTSRAGKRKQLSIFASSILFVFLCQLSQAQTKSISEPTDTLDRLADEFWGWRAKYAPFTGDDVPRIERPLSLTPDWSASAIVKRREQLETFESRLAALKPSDWPVRKQVDYMLVGSALARVRWELDVNPRWQRDPNFYIEQTLTPILEYIAVPGPYDAARSREILQRLNNIAPIVESARQNLRNPPAPFVKAAIRALSDSRTQLQAMSATLLPETTLHEAELTGASNQAAESLVGFRTWLQKILPQCPQSIAIGHGALSFYLHQVALLPYTPEELLTLGRLEAARASALRALEIQRNQEVPPLSLFSDTAAEVKEATQDEIAIRSFLEKHQILTVPSWVPHYAFRPIPEYVQALSAFGEADDFTSATRLKENATRYIYPPSSNLDLFWLATAKDPRPILLHEGIPGHHFQLSVSWANLDPIRRHFYDSAPNEGLGFYSEEMMLQSGFFEDSPHAREMIYDFMLLRALGIEIDVKMALGEFTIEQAAAFLEKRLPLGHEMASGGATMFASWPGVVLEYQTGKTDILRFLADAKLKQGEPFRLRAFHDFLWTNGNVPIALQRWEYLGITDDVDRLRGWLPK